MQGRDFREEGGLGGDRAAEHTGADGLGLELAALERWDAGVLGLLGFQLPASSFQD